jgi:hypothetical protein
LSNILPIIGGYNRPITDDYGRSCKTVVGGGRESESGVESNCGRLVLRVQEFKVLKDTSSLIHHAKSRLKGRWFVDIMVIVIFVLVLSHIVTPCA